MPINVNLPKWAHVAVYVLSVAIVTVTGLASKGDLTITGPVAGVFATILALINSVDPEDAANTLPAAKLAAMADAKKLAASEAVTK
jgi:hypothetical protein